MGLVGAIILFVIMSLGAAMDGDYSGLEAIGKFILYAVIFFTVVWMINSGVYIVFLVIGAVALIASLCKK